jgi:hypothetical protein
MFRIVENSKSSPEIRLLALSLVRSLPSKDHLSEARAFFDFVRKNIRYTRDVFNMETLQTPEKTLEVGNGDCDDMVMLLSALLFSVGISNFFAVGGFREGEFEHVWLRAVIDNKIIDMDPTEPYAMGWHPPFPYRMDFR